MNAEVESSLGMCVHQLMEIRGRRRRAATSQVLIAGKVDLDFDWRLEKEMEIAPSQPSTY
jgi:hypothetical protein